MATDIIMPQLGESIAEGTIVKWLIRPGSRIEKDQPLLEVETDKVALEIPSPTSGSLVEVLVQEGQTVPVGTLLGRLDGGRQPDPSVVNRVGGVVVRQAEPVSEDEHYSPAVRQLAKERGVDLHQVVGTGEAGRITKRDVLDYLAQQQPTPPSSDRQDYKMNVDEEHIVPMTSMRKTIAERMVHSKHTSAHVATFFEADMSGAAQFRQAHGLTFLPFIVHAVARAIHDVPVLNSSWSDSGIVMKHAVHIGIAVAVEEGLLVPVVRHADRKGLQQIGKEVADLAERARTKKLSPEEVQGGTFTITNHGGFGSLLSVPIIHQPQVAILGVGAVQKRAVIINEAIAIRPMTYLSLSFDHRVLDGATADRFMSQLKRYLETSDWEKAS